MTFSILFSLSLLFGIANMRFKKYNIVTYFLFFIAFVFLISMNNSSPDEVNMEHSYQLLKDPNFQIDVTGILFYSVEKIFSNLGLSFGWFNLFSNSVATYLLAKSIKNISEENVIPCFIVYLLTICLLNITLFRQFIGSSFVIYGISVLLGRGDCTKNRIIAFISFLIGSLIHISMIVFLPLCITGISNKKLFRIIFFILLLYSIATSLNGNVPFGVREILSITGLEKLDLYINSVTRYGWLYALFLWIAILIIAFIAARDGLKNDDPLSQKSFNLVLYSFLFIPLCMMTLIYARLYLVILFVMIPTIVKWLKMRVFTKKRICLLIISTIYILYYYYFVGISRIDIFIFPIFSGSMFFI